MPILDHADADYSVAMSQWANGKLTVRARINTTAAVTSAEPFIVRYGEEGWTASTLAICTGVGQVLLGVSEEARDASTAALVTKLDLVVGGVTDIITTALSTTGYWVALTTGATQVYSVAGQALGGFGVWRVTSTSLTAAKECMLYGFPISMTS